MSTELLRRSARPFGAAALLFAGIISALLLFTCHNDFVSLRYPMVDYGSYTNFIWNSAHGAPFKYMVDKTYLTTHLSFTLLLLAPLFRLWDNPFLLVVVQWSLPLFGAAIVYLSALRLGLGFALRAALAALYVAYPYAQMPVLFSFHGVSLYFLLVPWFYHCLRFNRKWVWLPWLLILGLREDAGLLILPMLLYFGFAQRDRGARLLALLTGLYTILAVSVLFPALTGKSLAARRSGEMSQSRLLNSLTPAGLGQRIVADFWLMLPALPLLRRHWRPIWIFPSAGMLILLLSWWSRLYAFGGHYAAYVFPLFVAGLLEAISGDARYRDTDTAGGAAAPFRLAGWIMGTVVVAHFVFGRFPSDGNAWARRLHLRPDPATRTALTAARAVPRSGMLAVNHRLFALVANRADIAPWKGTKYGRPAENADAVFLMRTNPFDEKLFRRLTADGAFAVTYDDARFAVLVRATAARP